MKNKILTPILLSLLLLISVGCDSNIPGENKNTSDNNNIKIEEKKENKEIKTSVTPGIELNAIPEYTGQPYIQINNNIPYFTKSDLTTSSYESYSELDSLKRCGVCMACIGKDLMPTEKRGSIGMIKPSGWHTIKYDGVDGRYLYNRCHLIGYQLTGENANEKNLITGTRALNIDGMLPFENMVTDYIKETGNHVLYRVTPIYDGDNLLCKGVLMEGLSVEDNGRDISYCVFCYNEQPGIEIDHANGNSKSISGTIPQNTNNAATPSPGTRTDTQTTSQTQTKTYIVNTNTKKFHEASCSSISRIANHNRAEIIGTREELIAQGYQPCKSCNP